MTGQERLMQFPRLGISGDHAGTEPPMATNILNHQNLIQALGPTIRRVFHVGPSGSEPGRIPSLSLADRYLVSLPKVGTTNASGK